jgi:AraC-like DNA-binding protein
MASTTTAGRAVIGANGQLAFGFSRAGDVSYVTQSGTYRGIRHDQFLVGDSCPRTVVVHDQAVLVVVVVDRERLLHTARTMIGGGSRAGQAGRGEPDLLPDRGRLLPLRHARAATAGVFSGIFHTIDAVGGDAEALAALAIDDHIHRLLVMMLRPDAIASGRAQAGGKRQVAMALNRACDYVDAHLTASITLTRLEEVTECSARALQLAFQNRFGCSPLAWVRRRRLEQVRAELLAAGETTSIRDIAARYGFRQEGHFARSYRLQFGELPSETLARRRG